MIPKTIHYCWFGRNPKPDLAEKCIQSWKKFCPNYEIIEWNEDNYDIQAAPLFVRQAYEAKKWAFVTDYVRLQVVYENGGIYLDTDVEVIKSLDDLLQYNAFFGSQNGDVIATGLGFGAEKGTPLLVELMETYQTIPFIKEDGTYDITPCPDRDTKVFLKRGMSQVDSVQLLSDNIAVLPVEFLSPKDYMTGKITLTENSHTIHHFAESWMTEQQRGDIAEAKRAIYHPTLKERIKRRFVKTVSHKNIMKVRKLLKR